MSQDPPEQATDDGEDALAADIAQFATALSDVLKRRRDGPPKFRWVASFVLACRHYAQKSCLDLDQEGGTLGEWNQRLQEVYGPKPASGEPGGTVPFGRPAASSPPPAAPATKPQPQPLAAPVYDQAPEHRPARPEPRPFTQPPHGAAQIQTLVVDELLDDYVGELGERSQSASLSELRFFSLYGQYGARLFRAAEDHRDPDACYRLGLLLCIDSWPVESLFWLMLAEAEGHPHTSELVDTVTPRQMAVTHAHTLGIAAAAAGDADVAELFLERAADHGRPNAAFALGTLYMERHDLARAAIRFAEAARHGHKLGQWWADRLGYDER